MAPKYGDKLSFVFSVREFILIVKLTRCTNFSNLFWNRTLYVSDIFSVHHQERNTVHIAIHSNRYMSYGLCWQLATRCTNFSNLFRNRTLYVSDSFSVHHQECNTTHSNRYMSYGLCWLLATRCTNFSNLFWSRTLDVSDSFSVHHQECNTVHTAMGICHTGYADCLLQDALISQIYFRVEL
jgi:uncharacterized membrane protein